MAIVLVLITMNTAFIINVGVVIVSSFVFISIKDSSATSTIVIATVATSIMITIV